MHKAEQKVSRGVSVQKYAKRVSGGNAGWEQVVNNDILPRTHFRYSTAGFADGERIGTMYVTWYVTFRDIL